MAFKISVEGDEVFDDGEKAAFERHFVEEAARFVKRWSEYRNVVIKKASVVTDSESRDLTPDSGE